MRLFFFYPQASDVGESHSLVPSTVLLLQQTLFRNQRDLREYCIKSNAYFTVIYDVHSTHFLHVNMHFAEYGVCHGGSDKFY
jgi:hypothetical protein